LPIERLLDSGCARLKDGRTICPDPERGIPKQGCATRITDGLPASTEPPLARCILEQDERVSCGSKRLPLRGVKELVAGSDFDCARDATGSAWCWGENEEGGLGNGVDHTSQVPVKVRLPGAAVQLSAGAKHACALLASGQAYCWGENARGAVGIGVLPACCDVPDPHRPPEYLTPQRVRGLPLARSVHALADASCALTREGEVYCWGENGSGQLGSPASPPLAAPTLVRGLPKTRQLVMSEPSCALADDGSTYCWGDGCPLLEPRSSPERVRWR
jgi:alpha-tubulin suppressor-like RCC1 family protein